MIRAEDAQFHEVPIEYRDTWAESNYFPFFIPEAGLSGAAYCVFRPGLGVCLSDITIFDHCASSWEALAYTDNQQHIPCPGDLTDYALRNGLGVKVTSAPNSYFVTYQGIDDTEFAFTFDGIMRPQDFNDPDQDPITRQNSRTGGWDQAFAGHFDMTGHAQGRLTLRGKSYDIDCLATMDHSWGPRAERDNGSALFFQAHFPNGLSVNALMAFDPARPDVAGPVLHGFATNANGGDVSGLVSGEANIYRDAIMPERFVVTVKDEAGRVHQLEGQFVNWAPWAPYSSVLYYQGMCTWDDGQQKGYGAFQEVISRAAIARHCYAKK
tara:strand:- start:2203 stop:3174 length:972 start_codon:yes stop_codon:yes gene_type:complete